MKKLCSLLFALLSPFLFTAQADSSIFISALESKTNADFNNDDDSVEIWYLNSVESFKKVESQKYKPSTLFYIGEIYYNLGKMDVTSQSEKNVKVSPFFDSSIVFYKRSLIFNYKNHTIYSKLALAQLRVGQFSDAKNNLLIAFNSSKDMDFKNNVLYEISLLIFSDLSKGEKLKKSKNIEGAKEFFSRSLQTSLIVYEVAPNGEAAKIIYDISKEMGENKIKTEYKKILTEKYNWSGVE